jgi:hypothetical protein
VAQNTIKLASQVLFSTADTRFNLNLFNSSINEISERNNEQVSPACVTLRHFVQKTQIHTALVRSITGLSSNEIR